MSDKKAMREEFEEYCESVSLIDPATKETCFHVWQHREAELQSMRESISQLQEQVERWITDYDRAVGELNDTRAAYAEAIKEAMEKDVEIAISRMLN